MPTDTPQTEEPLWVCEYCFEQYHGDRLPDDWDLVWQSAVCPQCIARYAIQNQRSLPGGAYANGRPDPRMKQKEQADD